MVRASPLPRRPGPRPWPPAATPPSGLCPSRSLLSVQCVENPTDGDRPAFRVLTDDSPHPVEGVLYLAHAGQLGRERLTKDSGSAPAAVDATRGEPVDNRAAFVPRQVADCGLDAVTDSPVTAWQHVREVSHAASMRLSPTCRPPSCTARPAPGSGSATRGRGRCRGRSRIRRAPAATG